MLKPGDILAFAGHAPSSMAISLGSFGLPLWTPSHLAIIGELDGQLVCYESTTDDPAPCLVQSRSFDGVQVHAIEERLQTYPGKIWHYPLYRNLYDFERERLKEFLLAQVGKPYDAVNAIRSGGFLFSVIEGVCRRQALNALFCSELVAAAHATVGLWPTCNAGRWNPAHLIRAERLAGILCPPTRLK
jgi:hypothetical protein